MTLTEFETAFLIVPDELTMVTFCQQHLLHGMPFVFNERECPSSNEMGI
ncbi:hypothetical protein [Maritalea porphyrae]|mgnify:FL=1|nr:hypothetical protein [Maritalea porphyrae]MCZ4271301.1 hypothetical protein [Maritalea porphyrae]